MLPTPTKKKNWSPKEYQNWISLKLSPVLIVTRWEHEFQLSVEIGVASSNKLNQRAPLPALSFNFCHFVVCGTKPLPYRTPKCIITNTKDKLKASKTNDKSKDKEKSPLRSLSTLIVPQNALYYNLPKTKTKSLKYQR